MSEIVYLLTNPAMPDLVKIGRTEDLERRIKELSRGTGVPLPFECYFACEVERSEYVEKKIHEGFADHRINPKKEFFRVDPQRMKSILELVSIREVTPDRDFVEDQGEQHALDRARKNKPVFRFSMVDIPVGAELSYIKDENVVAEVVSDRKIKFKGEEISLTNAAKKLLAKEGVYSKYANGPQYWKFDGEILNDRRIRMEENEE